MVDMNRGTQGVALPPEVAAEIWQPIREESQVMRLAQQTPLPGGGVEVEIITGDAEASFVAETEEKPVSRPSLGSRLMRGYTIATIVPFSNQFRRDKQRLYNALVSRLPLALARRFDRAVLLGEGAPSAADFDTLADIPAVDVSTPRSGFLEAMQSVATTPDEETGGDVTGWLLSTAGELIAMGADDGTGRPLLIDNIQTEGSIGSIYARPTYRSRTVADAATRTVGYGGDWRSAHWGQVEGVTVSISDQATLTDGDEIIHLWQRNMFAVRAEIEVGFRVREEGHFVRLTGDLNGGS